MRLRVLDDDRPGYAQLAFDTALDQSSLSLSVRSLRDGGFLGPNGGWQRSPHFFAATRVGGDAKKPALLFEVDHVICIQVDSTSLLPTAMFIADADEALADLVADVAERLDLAHGFACGIIAAGYVGSDHRWMAAAEHLFMVHEDVVGRDPRAQTGPTEIAVAEADLNCPLAVASEAIAETRGADLLAFRVVGLDRNIAARRLPASPQVLDLLGDRELLRPFAGSGTGAGGSTGFGDAGLGQ